MRDVTGLGRIGHSRKPVEHLAGKRGIRLGDQPLHASGAVVGEAGIAAITGLDQPGGIAVASATVAYVHDQYDGELFSLNLSTGALVRVFGPTSPGTHGSGNDGALAWDAARSLLYWTDNGIHGISVFEPTSGDRVIISR